MARRFSNPDPAHRPHGYRAIFKWGVLDRLNGNRQIRAPGPPAPRVSPDLDLIRDPAGPPRLTWIGHASFLGTLGGSRFLIDPLFSERVGLLYPRHGRPGLRPEQLPRIDALLVTHCHYDHLDTPSVRALSRDVPVFVPLGLGRWFRRWRFGHVRELDWWDSAETAGLRITLVPARHWSRRWIADTNQTLWGGFVVEGGGVAVHHGGDSAWFDGFAEIGGRFPELLATMLPIGGYSPTWFMEHNHLNPEQAGRAFLDLGARHLVPMHWGALQLTDEPIAEPAERMRAWWQSQNLDGTRRLRLLAVGETLVLDDRGRELEEGESGGR